MSVLCEFLKQAKRATGTKLPAGRALRAGFRVDIDGTEKVTPMIIYECTKARQASFWQKLKGEWKKVVAEAKAQAKKIEKKM